MIDPTLAELESERNEIQRRAQNMNDWILSSVDSGSEYPGFTTVTLIFRSPDDIRIIGIDIGFQNGKEIASVVQALKDASKELENAIDLWSKT